MTSTYVTQDDINLFIGAKVKDRNEIIKTIVSDSKNGLYKDIQNGIINPETEIEVSLVLMNKHIFELVSVDL